MFSKIIVFVLLGLLSLGSVTGQTSNIAVNAGQFTADQGPFLATVSPFSFLPQSRETAVTWCAIHDAINSIDPQYKYCFHEVYSELNRNSVSKATPEAAVVGAFYTAYRNHTIERLQSNSHNKFLTPAQQQVILDDLENWKSQQLTLIRSQRGAKEKRIQDGLLLGEEAANAILEERWNDGWRNIVSPPTRPTGVLGQWSLTGYPGFAFEIYPQWKDRQPFIYNSQAEFPVVSPPHLNSTSYLQDLAETKSYGIYGNGQAGPNRTPDTIAKSLWWQGGGLEHSNLVLIQLAQRMNLNLYETVQAYTAKALAADHAMVNNVFNKDKQNFWRPFQAIRDTYNNGYAEYPGLLALKDPGWRSNENVPGSGPAGFTPSNQEYPCGHCEITSAESQAIALTLGVDVFPGGPITVNYDNPSNPPQPQTFSSFTDMQNQVGMGRIYLGVHLRSTNMLGTALGKGIAGKAASFVRRLSA